MPYYFESSEKYDFSTDIGLEDIKKFFRHHNSDPFFSMFETGFDDVRFDLIRIDPWRRYVRIFEFKTNVQDFRRDNKWQKYLPFCHTLTFVCPRDIIMPSDLPSGIGLMWIYKWKWKQGGLPYKTWQLDHEWKKRPRKHDVSTDTLLKIAFMLMSRVRWRKEDVF